MLKNSLYLSVWLGRHNSQGAEQLNESSSEQGCRFKLDDFDIEHGLYSRLEETLFLSIITNHYGRITDGEN